MSNTGRVHGPFVTKVHRRLVALMLAVSSSILGACNAATPREANGPDSSPTESRTRRAEALFLIHALGDTYDQWPTAGQQSGQLAAWIAGAAQRTSRLRAHMQVAKLESAQSRRRLAHRLIQVRYERHLSRAHGSGFIQLSSRTGRNAIAN